MSQYKTIKNFPLNPSLALSAIPIIFLIVLVCKYATNVPYWDQWDITYLFEKFYKSELTFSDFWRQHNEHRLVFSKLLFLGLGLLSKFDVRWEIATSIILSIVIFLLIIWHISKNKENLNVKNNHRLLWIVFSTFIFSLSQSENWLWGFQLPWFLNVLAVVAAAFILSNYKINFFTILLVTVCSIIATLSLSSGILIWLIVLFFLIVYQIKAVKKLSVAIFLFWVVVSASVFLLYLHGFERSSGLPSLFSFLESPLEFGLYIGSDNLAFPGVFIGDGLISSGRRQIGGVRFYRPVVHRKCCNDNQRRRSGVSI